MSVELPLARIASICAPRPVLFSGNQEGSLGGPTLPVPRMGDRFAVDVDTSQLRLDAESRILIAALTEATTADAQVALRQPNLLRPYGFGPAVVDGPGQTGSTLLLRTVQPGAAVVRGQFFSVVHGDVHYVHMATAQAIANPDGRMAVPIWPMLRFLTVDGEPVALDQPMIEGQLIGFDSKGATFTRNKVNALSFTIQERA